MSNFAFTVTKDQAEVIAADIMAAAARVPVADVAATIRLFGIRQTAALLDCRSGVREEVFEGPYLAPIEDNDPRLMAWVGVCTVGRTVNIAPSPYGDYSVTGEYGLRTLSAEESWWWENHQQLPDGWHQIAGRRDFDDVWLVEKTSSRLIDGCLARALDGDGPDSGARPTPAVRRTRKEAPLPVGDDFVEVAAEDE